MDGNEKAELSSSWCWKYSRRVKSAGRIRLQESCSNSFEEWDLGQKSFKRDFNKFVFYMC